MKEYLLLFWNESGSGQYKVDAEKMKEGMSAWQAWIGGIARQGSLISTKPINWEGAMVSNQGITKSPAIKDGQMVTGYLICKAGSMQEAENWAKTCPILRSPAGFTEVREVAPFEL